MTKFIAMAGGIRVLKAPQLFRLATAAQVSFPSSILATGQRQVEQHAFRQLPSKHLLCNGQTRVVCRNCRLSRNFG